MYNTLLNFRMRPDPYSNFNTATLWTDPHISGKMLELHLDDTSPAASRSSAEIDRIVTWIDKQVGLKGKTVLDLGCGPGLYARRMAASGAVVTGADFSPGSIAYANSAVEGETLSYLCLDYLSDDLPDGNDMVTLIYCDICALPPSKRRLLLKKIRASLKPQGVLIVDAYSDTQFRTLKESATYEFNLMNGFWSANPYFGFASTFLYPDLRLALDRYLIVEKDRTWDVFNWLQYFHPSELKQELMEAGFSHCETVDMITGAPWDKGEKEFALIARAG
ncbi:bifunctional 2-polyprenyl-6-hydroxyphenol methylase/3-demethylubiquinol 3-O-methyltransferase UbiG [Roseibium sp. MMSF_3544]|uniref:class I SAM-dependent methyltransferase n=1 Tax=unclassified Roseibium TaxID=2629323 RepID=UPI00273F7BE2|nr:class I SAM-dependent methyltransferase [Roseibium sp. MMSF_3544]